MAGRAPLVALSEVRLYLADRGALLFSLALPIAIIALMVGAFGGGAQLNTTAHVVNLDQGELGEQFVAEMDAIDGLGVDLLSEQDARRKLDRSAIQLYLVVPVDFSQRLTSSSAAEIVQVQRGNGGRDGQIIAGIASGIAGALGAPYQLRGESEALLVTAGVAGVSVPQPLADAVWAGVSADPPVGVTLESPEGEEEFDAAKMFFPRIAGWMMLFALTMNAQSIVEERRRGTLERLLTTRATRTDILLGKFLGNYLRGAIQLTLLFVFGLLAFDFFTAGSFLRSLVFGLLVLPAAAALGILVAAIARTEDQAGVIGTVFSTLTALFGGTFLPSDINPLFETVGKVTIIYWMNRGFDLLIDDQAGLVDIVPHATAMLAIGAVMLLLSRALFKPLPGGSR
jgi:ABC-2 type transport system permease protein